MPEFLNSTRRSVTWFKNAHDAGTLEMRPPFQRNPVWAIAQKSLLIDTILRAYPIPELYVQENVDERGVEHHVVVDGQQRLRACLEFLEGAFTLTDTTNADWEDAAFDDLSAEDKKRIFGYSFLVRQLPELPDPELREIFTRLNRNTVSLNKQELRHATYWGPFIKLMESLADHEFWTSSGVFTANDIRRMLDVEFVSELTVAYLHGFQNKKASLERWYEVYEPSFDRGDEVAAMFNTVLGEIGKILPDIHETRWRKKSDFYTLFLLLAAHSSKLPLSKTKREDARRSLVRFGDEVNSHISRATPKTKGVTKYAAAVEKAASDLGSRRDRAEVLERVLSSAFK
jgi:hypothetical protein